MTLFQQPNGYIDCINYTDITQMLCQTTEYFDNFIRQWTFIAAMCFVQNKPVDVFVHCHHIVPLPIRNALTAL